MNEIVEAALKKLKPHVVVLCTSSSLKSVMPQLEAVLAAKIPVVSTTEELAYPGYTNVKLAAKLDKLARKAGVAVLGTGVNPGFVMDALPVAMADAAVHLGPAAAAPSYLVIDKIVEACRQTGAQAVHPGYGFLSEREAFPKELEAAGIVFIGPNPGAIAAMGDKMVARNTVTRAGVPVVAKDTGADAAGLAYDALERARADGCDVLLVDTAGRLHNKTNLMEELAKIVRVMRKLDPAAPHSCLLVLDATTGQNAHAQVETFRSMSPVDALVLTKLDGSAKGGVLVALAEKFKLPVVAIGVGESIDDLRPFEARAFARGLMGLPA